METKKLTKKKRNAIYKYALSRIKNDTEDSRLGLCFYISEGLLVITNNNNPSPYNNMTGYPEIKKRRPKKLYSQEDLLYFPYNKIGQDKRISILKLAIKETQ